MSEKCDIIYPDADMRYMLDKLKKFYSTDDHHIIRALLRERIKRIDSVKILNLEV